MSKKARGPQLSQVDFFTAWNSKNSIEEIVAKTNMTEGSLRSRYHNEQKKLKDQRALLVASRDEAKEEGENDEVSKLDEIIARVDTVQLKKRSIRKSGLEATLELAGLLNQ